MVKIIIRKCISIVLVLALIFLFFGCQAKTDYIYKEYPLSRNGISIHLDCISSNSTDTDKNILLVHGLTYSSHEFDVDYKDYSLVRFLAKNGYCVWRLDITGYGQSELSENGFIPDSDYAAEDINAAVDTILKISGKEKIDLLGWSWGTVTSSKFIANHPKKINKLVLYAPIISGLGNSEVKEDYHINDWKHAASDFQMTENGEYDLSIAEKEVIEIYCSNCWRYDGTKSPNGGRRDICVNKSKKLIDLKTISVPTLVICGSNDPYIDFERTMSALDELPSGSKLKVIEGASHVAFIEKPYYKEFRETVLSFLK